MCNPVSTLHPEALLAKGMHQGYEWEVTTNTRGYRCGYVRIPPGHPWHGVDYDNVEPYPAVHGGLTFGEPDLHCGKGGPDDAWWLGFDCAHYDDAPDPSLPGIEHLGFGHVHSGVIRTTEYVREQCEQLAEQARMAAVVAELQPGITGE